MNVLWEDRPPKMVNITLGGHGVLGELARVSEDEDGRRGVLTMPWGSYK